MTSPFQKNNKGYTLLFAVIVSVLVLSIATFILGVSRKQLVLSSSARDSVYAFYAADSGLECALLNMDNLATSTSVESIECDGAVIVPTRVGDADAGTTTFEMLTGANYSGTNNRQSGVASCAITRVSYVTSGGDATTTRIVTESRGYNIGWNGTNCSLTGPRKVERALRYSQID